MRKLMSIQSLCVVLIVVSTNSLTAQRKQDAPYGPPSWVVDAWISGGSPVAPIDGPPAWVVEAWESGEHPRVAGKGKSFGPPAWVAARHKRAAELGLPRPPSEVIEAWKNGNGADLLGPPDFVWDLLGM